MDYEEYENGQELKKLDFSHTDSGTEERFEGFRGAKTQKRVYSRKELEGLRNVDEDWQKKKWVEIYCGLGAVVQQEYDGLVVDGDRKQKKSFGVDREEEEEEEDSDEDYSSIQKPAFFVSGEPDFDSGPPEDGLEFLRRVRWEAAQIPRVKVAKVDRTKLNKEQTNYMPQIPDIAKCPEQLMPLKEWEDAFLAEFAALRLALSRYGSSEGQLQCSAVSREESSSKIFESTLSENFDSMCDTSDDSECCFAAVDNVGSDSIESSGSKPSEKGASVELPTLLKILSMDSVARVSALRKRIDMAERMSNLSWNDCLWLFALSAAVDSPLHADTCASFRSLLRKCASLRAEKLVVDEEVAMLNILATISGRYFGQQGNSNS